MMKLLFVCSDGSVINHLYFQTFDDYMYRSTVLSCFCTVYGKYPRNNSIYVAEKSSSPPHDIYKEPYIWSQKQAKVSFILSVFMCIFGFILIAAAVIMPLVFKLRFAMSFILAILGVITEYIAVIPFSLYHDSLSQLNDYHKSLHEDERFRSSVNLIGKLSTAKARDNMLQEIIRSEIQMNLDELHQRKNVESDDSGTKKPKWSLHHSATSSEQ